VRRLLLAAAIALVLVPPASGSLMLGVLGSASRLAGQTGQHSQVDHVILGWNQGNTWGARLAVQFQDHGPVPMIAFTMSRGFPSRHEVITPRGVAFGKGDDYLTALNRAIADWGRTVYIRPFAEMNGHWNSYCAYTRSGQRKGLSHSTASFRKAFARVYLLLHGGTAQQLNLRLRRLGLPGVTHDYELNPAADPAGDLEPAGLRQPGPSREPGAGLLPGRPLRGRRRRRPLRHPRQGRVGRE
jgi:hypothetical protein